MQAPLAVCPSTYQVSIDNDHVEMPYRVGATISGWWLHTVASRRHLRSAGARKLVIRRTQTVLSARASAVSCAVVWNSLLTDLRVLAVAAATFAKHLKTFLARSSASEKCLFCIILGHALLCIWLYGEGAGNNLEKKCSIFFIIAVC